MRNSLSIICLLIAAGLFSCKNSANLVDKPSIPRIHSDSILWTISSTNLSEDMSVASTKNDEIIVLVYEFIENAQLNEPLIKLNFALDQKNSSKTFNSAKRNIIGKNVLFLLLEDDSDTSSDAIDYIFRAHSQEILKEFNRRNYSGLERLIGDEDILGVKFIKGFDCDDELNFNFNNSYKLDRYEYFIKVRCKE